MDLKKYQNKAMKMSDYEIIVEHDKLINEIEDKKIQLEKYREKCSGLFGFLKPGYSRFNLAGKVAIEEIKNRREKANILTKAIYSVRN